jgi:hypothetical protein
MDGDLRVDPAQLCDRAAELELVARALAGAVGDDLDPAVADWPVGVTLTGLVSAVSGGLGGAAARLAHSGALLREAAAGYLSADQRAATRLRRVG